MINIDDVEAAAHRIARFVRRTPLLRADQCAAPATEADLWLKLECLQPTGSFKARGATNKLLTTPHAKLARGIVTASGGNHGLAVARAARLAGVSATIFAPTTVSAEKVEKIRKWGGELRIGGALWDESNNEAIAFAEQLGAVYFHPFADPAVMAGQGTIGLEIADQLPNVEMVLVAIGGGGTHCRGRYGHRGEEAGCARHRHRACRLTHSARLACGRTSGPAPRGHDPRRHDGLWQD